MRKYIALFTLLVVTLAACSSASGGTSEDTAQSVVFEAAGAAGEDPFTQSVATVAATDEEVADMHGPATVTGMQMGNTPGLYGGSGDQKVCDSAALAGFLEENPDKARAWSSAIGIESPQIREYIDDLSPVVLTHDTRVTNHGYKATKATPRQSTLAAGTAVLVDTVGVPRVRCACGNPLAAPESVSGHEPTNVILIVPGPYSPQPPLDSGAPAPDPRADAEPGAPAALSFCEIYAAMKADVGGGPGSESIDAYVARLADWLSQLVTAAEAIADFPEDALTDLRSYRDAALGGPASAAGSVALRDAVEAFLESYCADPPPTEDADPPAEGDAPVDDPSDDPFVPNCGSMMFFLLIEAANGLGLDWESAAGTYLDQLDAFVGDSLDDILAYEEIGCQGAVALIELLEANGYPNPFA